MNKGQRKAGVAVDHENREKDDFYATDPAAVAALLAQEKFVGGIWEPACGQGHISRVLMTQGYDVTSTDLIDRGYGMGGVDFLFEPEMRGFCQNIVTNPPFKFALDFMKKACAFAEKTHGKVAMILPLSYQCGQERGAFYATSNLARIYAFKKRVGMLRGGDDGSGSTANSMVNYAWFVWDYGYPTYAPVIGWLP